jgi:predicted CXXCH cytochrome family protein
VTHQIWRLYFVANGTDWWVPHYPPDTMKRPTGPLCDGCHSVNYNIQTKSVTEWNVGCEKCHGGTANNADLLKPTNVMCFQCHGPNSPNGPRAATIEEHTHHKTGSAGNECVACHMPRIEQTIADVNVRSHTFRFISPVAT